MSIERTGLTGNQPWTFFRNDIDQVTSPFSRGILNLRDQLAGNSIYDHGRGLFGRNRNRRIRFGDGIRDHEDMWGGVSVEACINFSTLKGGKHNLQSASIKLGPDGEVSLSAGWYGGHIAGLKLSWGLGDQDKITSRSERLRWLLARAYKNSVLRESCDWIKNNGFGQSLTLVFQPVFGDCPSLNLSQEVVGKDRRGDGEGITVATVFRYSPVSGAFVIESSGLSKYVFAPLFGEPNIDLRQFKPSLPDGLTRNEFLELVQEVTHVIPLPDPWKLSGKSL